MTQKLTENRRNVHLISLGCARNRVDSEVMLGGMLEQGWAITQDPNESDAIVVNTCGFIASAKAESIDTILEMADYKKTNPNLKLVVAGCLTQRYKNQLVMGMPEVDLFVGTDEFPKLADLLVEKTEKKMHAKRTSYIYDGDLPKLNTLSKIAAYVKVAEGCQHRCAFCIIPAIRGVLRSRPVANVVAEVEKLASQGVMEINLIAQDLAAYGRDFGRDDLLPLLRELVEIEGIRWIRLLYVYPENVSDDFVQFLRVNSKIAPYLDIPVQHASNKVLKHMNRGVTKEEIRTTIQKLRANVPGIAIRTTVLVGFPGETEEDFAELEAFVKEMKFDHLGCFAYSQEEGTVAARYPNQIDEKIKTSRVKKIMSLQKKISRTLLKSKIGQVFDALVEGPSEETPLLFKARIITQAPEVDGITYINSGTLKANSMCKVKINASHDYDLVGEVVEPGDSEVSDYQRTLDGQKSFAPVGQDRPNHDTSCI